MKKHSIIISLACLVIIFTAMHFTATIINQLLLAVVIAVILRPLVSYLKKYHVPFAVALLIILGIFILVLSIVGGIIGNTIVQFNNNISFITEQAIQKVNTIYDLIKPLLAQIGLDDKLSNIMTGFDSSVILKLVNQIFLSFKDLLSSMAFILLTVIFILIDLDVLSKKLHIIQSHNPENIKSIQSIFTNASKYIEKKFVISLITAVVVYGLCTLFKVQFALMWSVLTLFFNFIPNIGVFIVSAPMVLQVFILKDLYVASAFSTLLVIIHFLSGNVFEPRIMARYLNISTLTVWLSLLFWNLILGPIGMLLSIPLTMTVKIMLDMSDDYQGLSQMMEGENLEEKLSHSKLNAVLHKTKHKVTHQ